MTLKQYIAAGFVAAALFVMIFVVPSLAEQQDLTPAMVTGTVSLIVTAAAVFFGGLTNIENDG